MANDLLTTALLQSMSRNLSVTDLIRTTETLKASGQADAIESLYATWIQHNSDHPLLYAILFNYSTTLLDAGKLAPARENLERALALNPEFLPAYINLGRVHERLGNIGLAVVQWTAVTSKLAAVNGAAITHKTTALNQAARVLESANQDEPAENMLHQSLELDPQQREVAQHLVALRQRQCEWPVLVPWERVGAETLMRGLSPLSAAAFTDDPILQLAIAANYNQLDVGTPRDALSAWPQAVNASGPLRIGYLCSDLREHALGYLLAEVFGLHDRHQVEVFAYYCGPEAKDPLHAQFQATADHWVSVSGMDDATAARRMAADGIQILVDLNGYTREARVKLVALRPAPVIVNWLGFPGTMASPYHHYLIADDWIVPEASELYYSERVLRLPCYQPSQRERKVASPAPTRSSVGLPEDAMVFCCFNGAHKINRFTFDRWLMILERVPGSVLWLLGSTDAANRRLREYATQRGVAPERLIFADKLANPFHLARYPLADLFLDTTPYGAHTTASDALWSGVPVLTLSGRSFASRVGGSLVRTAGLPELVCTTPAEFVSRAVELGNDRAQLQAFRDRLRARREAGEVFDMPGLVQRLEGLYQQMWAEFQAGQLPQPDLTNLDVYLEVGSRVNHEAMEVQTLDDYHGWWREQLAARHRLRPIAPDRRLATSEFFARA
jgi:predicted O-linked N-acetylglucosamine transferase (SPINDLY family)